MQTLLLDLTRTWDVSQQQALSLAKKLQGMGHFAPLLCCPMGAPLVQRARALELPLLELRNTSPHSLGTLARLWMLQRRQQHVLIHTFDPQAARLGWLIQRMRKPEATILLHSCFMPPAGEIPFQGSAWQGAEKVICGNSHIALLLRDVGLDSSRLPVIHPGLHLPDYPPCRPRRDGRFVFAALGDLEAEAGHSVLIKAMAALWQRTDLPPWEVRIIGSGPLFRGILDEAEALGVESRLALLGRQREGDVLPLCDALVIPWTGKQGNNRALGMGWATGLPVICTRLPVHRELVRKDDNHVLAVEPGDPQKLAAVMIRFMLDAVFRQNLARNGADMVPRISEEHMTEQCLDLYNGCIARHGWVLPPCQDEEKMKEEELGEDI